MACLPATSSIFIKLYIKLENEEEITWTTFLYPLRADLWIAMIITALILAIFWTLIERLIVGPLGKIFYFIEYIKHFWIAIKTNFGGEPGQN